MKSVNSGLADLWFTQNVILLAGQGHAKCNDYAEFIHRDTR